ncbi:MAG: HpaII family restriction endonuclease [Rikenellaceae bacterium]
MAEFKFIDLFAGIGGFHLAMHRLGGECVFASEIDESARMTYEANFMKISPDLFKSGMFNDDIRNISPEELPDFDLLCAGFPCQPFSQAGQKRGFEDHHKSERGNLFFNIAEIIEAKRPKAFFLENVRGLVNHDNGNTIKVIRNILENELNYSVYLKVVNASDYGLPQLRPRVFIIGFRDENFMKSFNFPSPIKLKFNMSDVWGGECSREIGFTLRVGGRGSNIDDRRNWDSYLVDGEVRRLSPVEGKRMQGFPEDFLLPSSIVQAMKQLGNSVAVDAVEAVGRYVIEHMKQLKPQDNKMVKQTKNKGEWSELYLFVQTLLNKKIHFANKDLSPKESCINVKSVTTLNNRHSYLIDDGSDVTVVEKNFRQEVGKINISDLITPEVLITLRDKIKSGQGTFEIADFKVIQDALGLSIVKGGTSGQKADILFDVQSEEFESKNEGYGIKSHLGNSPTLFNASGSTNFIYKIHGLSREVVDSINEITTRTKIVDRINVIIENGGSFEYIGAENKNLNLNLKTVDGDMPQIVGQMLMCFYKDRISTIKNIVETICTGKTSDEHHLIETKTKRLLLDILLGFFPGKRWNGEYGANGTVVVKENGESVAFHIVDQKELKEYLFENIKFDTPSSTRHRFGKIYIEKSGQMYFKLNMQLRFKQKDVNCTF